MRKRRFEPIALLGVFVTLLLHVGTVAGIFLYRRALEAAQKPPPAPSYVVARLIRKGVKKDPKKLPDKIVPQLSTQKKTGVDYTADAEAKPNKPKKKKDAQIADRNRNALDKLDLLAKAQQEIEAEGDPDGVVNGSASGRAGDRYMTRIADIWNRNWSLPAVIPAATAKTLYVLVVIQIDKSGQIQFPIQFDRHSGNDHFDNSVIVAWRRIKRIPIPPPDRLASILANGLALKLNWRGLQ
jgi:hypothetical protein